MAKRLGMPLMPWQQYVADVALEVDPDTGLLAYREVVLTVPRQSGKTSLLLALAVHRALGVAASDGPQRITYTAQSGVYARAKFLDEQVPLLESSPIGRRRPQPFKVRRTNGHEAILWSNGSKHGIAAATDKAGHGGSLDLVILDEAFAHTDAKLEQGLKPTMITRPQPQQWVVSTAGTPESTYLWGKVENGRQRAELGLTEGACYFEWSADDSADPGSVEVWKSCMPALRHAGNPGGTQPIEAVASEYASMDRAEFCRAFLNIWDPKKGEPVISLDDWAACLDPRSAPADPVCFAFDVAPDRGSSSIAVAGSYGDKHHVEVVANEPGTGWVVGRLVELRDRHRPRLIVCDAAGPAGSLLAEAEAAALDVKVVSTKEHIRACGGFYDDVVGTLTDELDEAGDVVVGDDGEPRKVLVRRLTHLGQPELVAALDGASKRTVADAWLWSRKSSSVDISPLVAVTLARAASCSFEVDVADSVW